MDYEEAKVLVVEGLQKKQKMKSKLVTLLVKKITSFLFSITSEEQ